MAERGREWRQARWLPTGRGGRDTCGCSGSVRREGLTLTLRYLSKAAQCDQAVNGMRPPRACGGLSDLLTLLWLTNSERRASRARRCRRGRIRLDHRPLAPPREPFRLGRSACRIAAGPEDHCDARRDFAVPSAPQRTSTIVP
jgi:hypothetical protein